MGCNASRGLSYNSEYKRGRAASIRLLAQYINLSGCAAYVLPERYFGSTKTKDRHIFTDAELSRLFSAIDSLLESGSVPYSRQMLPVLSRLIYTCGLHPQEGRTLKRRDSTSSMYFKSLSKMKKRRRSSTI